LASLPDSSFGWVAYAPRTVSSYHVDNVAAADDGQALRPQLADVGRLARRVVRSVLKVARADEEGALTRALRLHAGDSSYAGAVVEESWRAYDHVNVQAGLDAWLAQDERSHELLGIVGFQHREFGIADLLLPADDAMPWMPKAGSVATANRACGPDGAVRACVQCGLYLVSEGPVRSALLLRGADEHGAHNGVSLQVLGTVPGRAEEIVREVRALTVEHNVFRSQVLSFGGEVFEPGQSLLSFHRRPRLGRQQVILPAETLDAVDRQVVGVGAHRTRLDASGQHLKRGLLLYGPPGTGKTHTVRYLESRLTETTILQLSGGALHLVSEACSIARTLQPAMIVIEDVDLIAEDRGMYPGQHPLLFQLLNEMDGLAEDADIVFVLTTNRADLLEPALAARPGRVDQAVALDVPTLEARRALVELYRGQLVLDRDAVDDAVRRTEGVTASFIKELLRRAAVIAAEAADRSALDKPDAPLTVSQADMETALDELLDTRNAMTRVLLGGARSHVTSSSDATDDEPSRPGAGFSPHPHPAADARASAAHAVEVVQSQLVEPFERHPALGRGVRVERLRPQGLDRLARREGRYGELVDTGVPQGLLHLSVGAKRAGLLPQDQVVAHAARGRGPHTVHVLGPRRLEVEVPRPDVPAGLDDVDGPERPARIARTEAEVLVVARPGLAVEVDVEELAVPKRLRQPVRVVQAGHLLMPDLRVEPDQLRVGQLVDEGQRVPDRRQQDVPARLVRLRLDREADVIAPVEDVLPEDVERLLAAVKRRPDVLGRP
jgi:hypothetical protein